MQRKTTSLLAEQTGLQVLSFRHFDCLLFHRGEVLKMFMPETRRAIGGSPKDRLVSGYLIAAFQTDLIKLRTPSKRFDLSDFIAQISVMNFPWLVSYSALDGEAVDQRFKDGISALLSALPSDRIGWQSRFGDNIFSVPHGQRLFPIVSHLREVDRL